MVPVRTRSSFVPIASIVLALAACDEGKKASEQSAADTLAQLAPVLKEDVEQVRRGLPQGAEKLGSMLDADTMGNPAALQKAVARARATVKDLAVAKTTFFSFADTTGRVVRSEADPDVLADKSILAAFGPLKKAMDPGGGLVEAWGEMKELRGAKTGPDLEWVAAAPVKGDKGQIKGMLVTGWSLRALAYHLENAAKLSLAEAAEKTGKKNPPLVYVFVVKGKTAYGPPIAPDVNEHAIEGLDLVGKTSGGSYRGALEITGRVFGVAGARAPELGDDAALAVLASEI